jgi:hypothetical protein
VQFLITDPLSPLSGPIPPLPQSGGAKFDCGHEIVSKEGMNDATAITIVRASKKIPPTVWLMIQRKWDKLLSQSIGTR